MHSYANTTRNLIPFNNRIDEVSDKDYYPLPVFSDERGTIYLNHSLDELREMVKALPVGGERDALEELKNKISGK